MPNITNPEISQALEEIQNRSGGDPTGNQHEVRVRPRDGDGQPLYGSIVYYVSPSGNTTKHEYSSGDYVSITATGNSDGPSGGVAIGLYGRTEAIEVFEMSSRTRRALKPGEI